MADPELRGGQHKCGCAFAACSATGSAYLAGNWQSPAHYTSSAQQKEDVMATLDGKVAIITGGNSGIGATIAQVFGSKGASVVIAARRVAEGEVVAGRIGPAASFFPTDVTEERDVAALVRHAVERFGRLDCLVNNAGNPGVMSGIAETEAAHWDNVFAVHVRGAMLGMKHAAPLMTAQGSGSIITIASTSGHRAGFPRTVIRQPRRR
jgi:NAD(P)-dependent dehydrogenase (short-subunit alcohol dehydrogenase family)